MYIVYFTIYMMQSKNNSTFCTFLEFKLLVLKINNSSFDIQKEKQRIIYI